LARRSILGALAAARDAGGPEDNDPPPGEAEGMFVSSTATGDAPPQKRAKTAAGDADVIEKVRFLCLLYPTIAPNSNVHTAPHGLLWTADHCSHREQQTHIFTATGNACLPGVIQI